MKNTQYTQHKYIKIKRRRIQKYKKMKIHTENKKYKYTQNKEKIHKKREKTKNYIRK